MRENIARPSTKYQYFATIFANLLTLNFGVTCGWSSPSLLLLTSDDSPLPTGKITIEESSLIASLMCVGGFIGNLLFAWIAERYGRRLPLLFCAVPQIVGWILTLFAQNVYYLYAARILAGFCGGAAFVIIPLFVTEISDDKVRGSLGSLMVFCSNTGILAAFVIGNYFEYETAPKLYIVLSLIFVCGFSFFPESPQFLLKQDKLEDAKNALCFYKNYGKNSKESELFKTELNKLKSICGKDNEKLADENQLTWADFTTPVAKKAIIIGVAMVALNQLCGCFAMLNYTAKIFAESGSSLSPNMSAIVVGSIQLCGAYSSTILVDRSGRKLLLAVSSAGIGVGLTCLGGYTLFKSLGFEMESLSWIPVTSFSATIFIAAVGVLTLPFVVISEVMPDKIRGFGTSFCMSLLWILAFFMIICFPMLSATLGMHGSMFLFAGVSFAGAAFIIIVLPETKGKSFEEIMELLK